LHLFVSAEFWWLGGLIQEKRFALGRPACPIFMAGIVRLDVKNICGCLNREEVRGLVGLKELPLRLHELVVTTTPCAF